jgi:hypothetical protein
VLELPSLCIQTRRVFNSASANCEIQRCPQLPDLDAVVAMVYATLRLPRILPGDKQACWTSLAWLSDHWYWAFSAAMRWQETVGVLMWGYFTVPPIYLALRCENALNSIVNLCYFGFSGVGIRPGAGHCLLQLLTESPSTWNLRYWTVDWHHWSDWFASAQGGPFGQHILDPSHSLSSHQAWTSMLIVYCPWW